MTYYSNGSQELVLGKEEISQILNQIFENFNSAQKILIIPPDYTRFHSGAGLITVLAYEYFGKRISGILPALGTHVPMTSAEIDQMFPGIPHNLFKIHDWRHDVITVGEVPADFVSQVSEGKVDYSWPAQLNKCIVEDEYDLILSIGQVVPHEVIGMANHNKNIFVGTGGKEGINKSHFIGAVYGMERMMGRAETPVRKILNYASEHFTKNLNIVYILTVVENCSDLKLRTRGLYAGSDDQCFLQAAELSMKVNFQMLEKPIQKAIVWLDPDEYKSTWLGNKSIYRTRMAIADGGELIVLAPGLKEFGEDKKIDELIRKYGYAGTEKVLEYTKNSQELSENLSAAAHLIHGSSEGRFKVTYCPGKISRDEILSVHFDYAELESMLKIYNPKILKPGFNILKNGEEVFYVQNPALGLWAHSSRFINI